MNRNESGEVNILLIVVIFVSLIAVGFAVAFFWAYGERNHYMNDSDAIVAEAVEEAKEEQKADDVVWHEEEMKKPYWDFQSPGVFGSVKFQYPKTWAAYNAENTATRYSAYFNVQTVLPTSVKSSIHALRILVTNQAYEAVLKSFESAVTGGKLTATPVVAGLVDDEHTGFNGVRFDGTLDNAFNGSAVIFKIRDKTLTVRTDSQDFMADFNNIILPSLSFTP